MESFDVFGEEAMVALGRVLARRWAVGDVVFLHGELGAGKSTLVRGVVAECGGPTVLRSPTYNLVQTFETDPPILHADLYRVISWQGIGIEDLIEDHLSLIEWPDRMVGLVADTEAWRIDIEFLEEGRRVSVRAPKVSG
ncbi:MAG: tRNA (adenosine(37)-N6)-threonylcarbamoyltransferase complex ATPase subunit type 1 TsaE [Chthonomonas sp.]|nr:tRNA (adenosine(37)-N6)-threonylcarbamoyltransferase complex ATPase subunit type 1 TsaE [Chthonomonas sp.]